MEQLERTEGLKREERVALELPYRPRDPKTYRPAIGLIACGWVTEEHLKAYRKAGYNVVALCDPCTERAEQRRREFYPRAEVYSDYRGVLERDDIEVVDIAAHPAERKEIIRAALEAGKHVLSQKPFVTDLDEGERLVELAERRGVRLAVNQNGRWAPHFSYMRSAVEAGLIGTVIGAHLGVHWNHNWIAGTVFDKVHHIVLYDFAIHWFDVLTAFMGGRMAKRVVASLSRSPAQQAKPPLLARVIVEYEGALATLAFDGDARIGLLDQVYLTGTEGSLLSIGPGMNEQTVTLHTAKGTVRPRLEGTWYPDGFHGTMGELLCAIEEKRQPSNNAADNLRSLGLCFAVVAAAESGESQVPGKIRRLLAGGMQEKAQG